MNPVMMEMWRCETCKCYHPDEESAAICCTCRTCGDPARANNWMICDPCDALKRKAKNEEMDAKERALPLVEDDGGPVCVGYTYYRELDEFLDVCEDQGWDPSEQIVHTCTVGVAYTPSLWDHISETWAEGYEDFDSLAASLTPETSAALEAVQKMVESEAPELWNSKERTRIDMSAYAREESK